MRSLRTLIALRTPSPSENSPISLINNAKLKHKKGRRKWKSTGVKCRKEGRNVMALRKVFEGGMHKLS